MAGTREAQLAETNPVSKKQAAAPILAWRARPSEICPALMAQHFKGFRVLQQGAAWARRLTVTIRLARLRKLKHAIHPSAWNVNSPTSAQTVASVILKRNPVVLIGVDRHGVGRDNSARWSPTLHNEEEFSRKSA